jgi:hypothetical protein
MPSVSGVVISRKTRGAAPKCTALSCGSYRNWVPHSARVIAIGAFDQRPEHMDDQKMSSQQVDAIGKLLSTVIIALLGAVFAYGYLSQLMLR